MPCILKVHVEAARGLPAMDSTSEVADAYVEIRFSDSLQRTSVCRKTLNPVWREDFRFEVSDDTLLQDAPLELKVFDFDAITTDDSVGMVTVDLNPLVSLEGPSQMAGWFPIYDTIRGARGELWVQVKVEFFENTNPFKESSAGIHLFSSSGIPVPYTVRQPAMI
jgi:Ca2+-dependent lipid-binding protein